MYENTFPNKRYKHTIEFLEKHISKDAHILDLGIENPFSRIMKERGYIINNTKGEDLDSDHTSLKSKNYEVTTAFEIFEHLLAPLEILKNLKGNKLVTSIPLRLWFAPAYRSKTDKWDRHYHEFEDWQFNWLLEKSGWRVIASEKFTNPVKKIGLRPLLRIFTPRYYMVYAERI